jgi:hypothetical protein
MGSHETDRLTLRPGRGQGDDDMQAKTRTLASAWLGAAGLQLLLCMVAASWVLRTGAGPEGQIALVAVCMVTVVWVTPPVVAAGALLQGREFGHGLLLAYAGVCCLIWLVTTALTLWLAVTGIGKLFAAGPFTSHFPTAALVGLLGAMVMLAFSVLTVRWLLRDPPAKWDRPGSGSPEGQTPGTGEGR